MPTATQYQLALTACMDADPPKEYRLSDDASALTDVFAEMVFLKEPARELSLLKPKQLAAYERWKQPN